MRSCSTVGTSLTEVFLITTASARLTVESDSSWITCCGVFGCCLVAMPGVKEAGLLAGGAGSGASCSVEEAGLTFPRSKPRSVAYLSLLPRLLMLGLWFSEARLALTMREIERVGRVGETSDV